MTRRRRWFVVLGIAGAGVAAAVLLLSLLCTPIAQESSGYTAIGFRLYTFTSVSLFGGSASPSYTYRGVTFSFHLWCAITPGGGEICGNATEPGGAVYSYSFWDGPPAHPPPWTTWVSPDGHEAVQYQEGGLAHLLVGA